MKTKYPPLHLLSIFEAAGRLENFKAASEELFITPSAVSHQIKALEKHLGFELFQRKPRGVALNPAGKTYLQFIQQGLSSFEQGTKTIKHRFSSPTLKISCFTTMASNIIIPQIGAFQQAHPEMDIRIETGNQLCDLRYDDVDLAIRVGEGKWPNLVTHKITDIDISAVCSPEFYQKHEFNSFEDINQLPLIDLTYMDDIWRQWADAIDIKLTTSKRAITFSDYDSSIRAASQGLGMALAMFPVEKIQLERGVIVAPFREFIPFPQSLYAVYRQEDRDRHDIKCFIDWLSRSPALTNNQ